MNFCVSLIAVQLGFRPPAVSFQLAGETHEAFSVQNNLILFSSKAAKVLSEIYCLGLNVISMQKVKMCGSIVVELEFPRPFVQSHAGTKYEQTDVKKKDPCIA